MYIGKINERLSSLTWQAVRSDGKMVKYKDAGDPLSGERLTVSFTELVPYGLDLQMDLGETVYLNSVVLRFAPRSAPMDVSLYGESGQLLDSYCGETGKAITEKEITLCAEGNFERLTVRIMADLSDVSLEDVALYGADLSGDRVYPTPASVTLGEGVFSISDHDTFTADCEAGARAAAILGEKLCETEGVTLREDKKGRMRLSLCPDVPENGYRLTVEEQGIALEASDLRGFVQGAETLLKLVKDGKIPVCRIEDAPFCAFRGVHLFLPATDQMEFTKRLIKYVLSPMGYNHIIMEVAGAMRFRSHPEINEAFEEANRRAAAGQWPAFPHGSVGGKQTVEQEAIRDLVAYARSFGIEVIPEVQSLGHVQFMTLAHPEIAERAADAIVHEATDERLADVPPNEFYAHCFCPSNPLSYEILFDLLDEVIEVFEPKQYVHMGHDEIYQIGVCPVCAKFDPADLLAEDLCRLHGYLAERGLRMMIWSDMLQPVTKYRTPAAADRIPKDIVMLDFIWYFHMGKDIEDNLLAKDFSVIMGNMYSSHYPRFESRIRKPGMSGGQVSAWVQTDEQSLAREGKLYDFLYSAQMLWSESYVRHSRYAYDRVISALLPRLREQLKGVSYPSLGAHTERVLLEDQTCDPAEMPCGLDVTVGGRYDSLIVTHTAICPRHRYPWLALEEIGTYVITYEDGTEEILPVTYGGNIGHYARRYHQPFTQAYYRHNGYITSWETDGVELRAEDGKPVTFYRIEWRNPRPEATIARVCYRAAEGEAADVAVRSVIGVQR